MRLGGENADASDLLDLSLGFLGEKFGFDDDGLVGENTLAQNLGETILCDINDGDGGMGVGLSVLLLHLFADKVPDSVQVNDGAVELIEGLVEVSHTNLSEVSRVVLVKVDPVMVLTTSVTTSTGVAPVLTDTTVTGGHVSSLLAVFVE